MGNSRVWAVERLRDGVDGRGIRTLVLLSGCPLRCRFCLNTQSWDPEAGRIAAAGELYKEVARDLIYFHATGGGVTFGGGEPLLHPEFICDFARETAGRFSIFAETSLQISPEALRMVIPAVDAYIVDIKTMDPELYRSYTGGCLETALANLTELVNTIGPERILVRIPRIPGLTDEISQQRSVQLLRELGLCHFDLFTYRTTQTGR